MRNPSNARAWGKHAPSIRPAGLLALAITAASAPLPAQDAREWVGAEAARKAGDLSNEKDPEQLATLAAAHAELRDFAKAVEFQTKANTMYDEAEAKTQGEARLKLYQDKTPFRDVKP